MTSPEARDRETIDRLLGERRLEGPGPRKPEPWRGVVMRQPPLQTGLADYLRFVDRAALGAIEA